jgi:hypothetical protein
MAIFTRLFTTRIVARSESPFFSNFNTLSDANDVRCLICRKSDGCNEKYATSEADIIPESISNNTVTTISIMVSGGQPRYSIKPIILLFFLE